MKRRCERCAGPVLEEADGDRLCLHCAARDGADAHEVFIERLADAILQLEQRDRARERARVLRPDALRWDAVR